jgi:hypothetical protein
MTEFLDVPGGRIAFDVTGSGPLVVLSHGVGGRRQAYRVPGSDAGRHRNRPVDGRARRDRRRRLPQDRRPDLTLLSN